MEFLYEIVEITNDQIKFKTINKKKEKELVGYINFNSLKWTLRGNKSIEKTHKIGDIILIKNNKNIWN